ncbi:hypothetical protein M3226_05150 [Neobacillus cucumis]|uniref:hypothetical protein n=1 Tax=Neobacillus cucumis TaxID=1740721 RepID=UPI00204154B7|nr:hypothetical protein [Neobacillus cucumis]MCM3725084.1 hypothetical protein [Neobacillus cucumis]
MKLKIVGPAVALLLLVGGVGVSAETDSNNGIPEQLADLKTTVSNLVNEVTNLLPLKDDVKSVKDELANANTTISEQQTEIDSLKKEFADLKSSSSSSVETITPEEKASILKVVKNNIGNFTTHYVYDPINPDPNNETIVNIKVVKYDIKEIAGKEVLQIFTEGNYDWTSAASGQNDGPGFSFARNFIFNCDPIFKTLGVNLDYEFYQNGEKVTPTVAQ